MRALSIFAIALSVACSTPNEITDDTADAGIVDAFAASDAATVTAPGRIVSQMLFHTNHDGTRADIQRIQYDTALHSIVTLGYDRHARLVWLPTDSYLPVRRLSEAPPAAHSAASRVFADTACSVPFAITGDTVKPRFMWQTIAVDPSGLPSATAVYTLGAQIPPSSLYVLAGTCAPMGTAQLATFGNRRAFWQIEREVQPEELAEARIGSEVR